MRTLTVGQLIFECCEVLQSMPLNHRHRRAYNVLISDLLSFAQPIVGFRILATLEEYVGLKTEIKLRVMVVGELGFVDGCLLITHSPGEPNQATSAAPNAMGEDQRAFLVKRIHAWLTTNVIFEQQPTSKCLAFNVALAAGHLP